MNTKGRGKPSLEKMLTDGRDWAELGKHLQHPKLQCRLMASTCEGCWTRDQRPPGVGWPVGSPSKRAGIHCLGMLPTYPFEDVPYKIRSRGGSTVQDTKPSWRDELNLGPRTWDS